MDDDRIRAAAKSSARHEPVMPVPRRSLAPAGVLLSCGVLAALLVVVWRRPSSAPHSVMSASAPVASAAASPSASAPAKRPFLRELEMFGARGGQPGQFLGAKSIAVDGAGNVWVADYDSPRVQKLDPHGRFLLQINRDTEGQRYLLGLAADARGNVFLASHVAGAPIAVHSADDGRLLRKIAPSAPKESFAKLVVDAAGALYAIMEDDNQQFSVVRMDAAGRVLARYQKTPKHDLVIGGKPAVDGEARVYVSHFTDNSTGQIYVYDAKGTIIHRWGSGGSAARDEELGFAALAWDAHGHVLVANGAVWVFNAEGGGYLMRGLPGAYPLQARDLALAPDGTLYVLFGNETIRRYALDLDALPK